MEPGSKLGAWHMFFGQDMCGWPSSTMEIWFGARASGTQSANSDEAYAAASWAGREKGILVENNGIHPNGSIKMMTPIAFAALHRQPWKQVA